MFGRRLSHPRYLPVPVCTFIPVPRAPRFVFFIKAAFCYMPFVFYCIWVLFPPKPDSMTEPLWTQQFFLFTKSCTS